MAAACALGAALLTGAGCRDGRDDPPALPSADVGSPSAQGGGPPAPVELHRDEVARRLADARCERLRDCGRIGASHRHATMESCVSDEQARALDRWRVDACLEIRTTAANACVDQATHGACESISEQPLYVPLVGQCAASNVCSVW